MILKKFTKQPNEFKDYDVDFSPWLTPINDTLDDETHSVVCLDDPLDTALTVTSVQLTPTKAKVWVGGGTDGYVYKVTLLMTSVGGRTDESELIFAVGEV